MKKTLFSVFVSLALIAGISIGQAIAQPPLCRTRALLGPNGPDICVSVVLQDQGGNLKNAFLLNEEIWAVVSLENVGNDDILALRGFSERGFHLFLRFTLFGPDGKQERIVPIYRDACPEPPPPPRNPCDQQGEQVDMVEVLPGPPDPWVWTTDPFNVLDFYSLDRPGRYTVKVVMDMKTYSPGDLITCYGSTYALVTSGDLWDLESNTVNFSITADADGDGYYYPEAYGVHPEADCDDTDPDVNPGMTEVLNNGKDDDCNPATPDAEVPPESVFVDIRPHTLNLVSRGKWVTCYIEFGGAYNVEDIDVGTVAITSLEINGQEPPVVVNIPAEEHPTAIGDQDGDLIPDLMVKFDRQDLQNAIGGPAEVEITVEGQLTGGALFSGTCNIAAIRLFSTDTQGQRSKRFSAGEEAVIKWKFGVANPCFVKGIVRLVDKSSGAVLGTFKTKGKAFDSGVHGQRKRVRLPDGLAPGTKVKAVLLLKRFDTKGGTPIGIDKQKIVLVIE